jgi:hypothetical protein
VISMSLEVVNAKMEPSPGGPPSYYDQSRRYTKSAKTVQQQEAFLAAYEKHGTLTHAAREAGVHPSYHHKWIEIDPDYPAKFKEAHRSSVDHLEREARRRALEGVEEPTGWYKGEPGGFVKKYSDTLLIFLLKGALPEKYKDRFEHTGKNGGPIEVQSTVTIEQFPVWLKQAIVVVSSGVMIDPEVERLLQSHFETKFLEAEKVVDSGNVSNPQATSQPTYQVLPEESGTVGAVEMVIETAVEASSENVTDEGWTPPVQPAEQPRSDWRPVKRERVTLDMDDI